MAKNSRIEWTHHTFNPWWGCVRVSPACKNCYAETFAHRLGLDLWGKRAARQVAADSYWMQPLRWDRAAGAAQMQARVFCASMADVFENRRDLDASRQRLWGLIERTPNLTWLILTKRPEAIDQLVPWTTTWPGNIWLGTTAEDQRRAQLRIPELLRYPVKVHFVSCEPLLGPVDLSLWMEGKRERIRWVIAGGESGHYARPVHPYWLRQLRDQCAAHAVAFHFKQWGNWRPVTAARPLAHRTKVLPSASGAPLIVANMGKKAAGRDLDGIEWNEVPEVAYGSRLRARGASRRGEIL